MPNEAQITQSGGNGGLESFISAKSLHLMAFGADSDKALLAFKICFEILCIRITNIYNI